MTMPPRETLPWRRWAAGALTVMGVAVTLATSEPTVEVVDIGAEGVEFEVWEATMVLGGDEAAGQTFLSFPMELLEQSTPEMRFSVTVEADRLEHTASPTTDWAVSFGDLEEPGLIFEAPLQNLDTAENPRSGDGLPFHNPWEFVFSESFDPLVIATDPAACESGACLPCDETLTRCELVLTVDRISSTLPRTRVSFTATMNRLTAQKDTTSRGAP